MVHVDRSTTFLRPLWWSSLLLAVAIAPPAIARSTLSANAQHACSTTFGGGITCFGTGLTGQLGNGTNSGNVTPADLLPVAGLPLPARQVAAGFGYSCAVLVDGSAYCWGRNTNGQLGNGRINASTTAESTSADLPVTGLQGATSIAAGNDHTCAIVAGGEVRCWGNNASGQLGDGSSTRRPTPVAVEGVRGAVELALGSVFSCALIDSGKVRCWGGNTAGQLGLAELTSRIAPTDVPGVSQATSLSAGSNHVCAVVQGGEVMCWGDNRSAQGTGIGLSSTRLEPAKIASLTDAVEVSARFEHTCVRHRDSTVSCWGGNRFGQLGRGTQDITATNAGLAREPVPGLTDVIGLSGGQSGVFTCAELRSGEVRCWGGNGFGQLRTGDTADQVRPIRIQGIQVSSGLITAGAFTSPGRSGEGMVVDYGLSNGQPTVVVGLYTYDAQGRPLYLIGSSPLSGIATNEFSIPVVRTSGARFGSAFRPADVVRTPWGTLHLRFHGCDAVAGSYRSTDTSFPVSGPISMQRLGPRTAEQGCAWLPAAVIAKTSPAAPDAGFAGTWFDPARDGEGVQVSFLTSNGERTAFLTWYTYGPDGTPLFITGAGRVAGSVISFNLFTTRGPRFSPDYLNSALQVEAWGTAQLRFPDCGRLQLDYLPSRAGFDLMGGTLRMQRLLAPALETCTP